MARILLVEDDVNVRPLMRHIIQGAGHQLTTLETLANAIILLDRQPFDLVVTDVNLPDGSGLRIADKAQEQGVRALVITGYGLSLKPGTLDRYDHLLKPVRADELLDAIRQRLPRADGHVVPLPM